MSHRAALLDNLVYLVRWGTPSLEEPAEVRAEARRAQAIAGRPVVHVAVIDADQPPPDEQTVALFVATIDELLRVCASVHVVLIGRGPRLTNLRSLAAKMMVLAAPPGVFMHDSLEHALERASLPPERIARIVDQARRLRLIDDDDYAPPPG